nr:hypothetical protein [Tanacetum cinerariifolium]
MDYGDYQIGNVTIYRVYYMEGLGHNLFSVGQFCDSDLEVTFRQHTCFIRNLDGVDLLTGIQDHAMALASSLVTSELWCYKSSSQAGIGPMRVESVNGKKYILAIVDDYSRFTWVKFLRSKDETLDFIIKFLKMIQVRLKVPVRRIQTDNGAEFVARSPQQNGVVERRNRTLIEATRTMLIYAQAPLFLWAEVALDEALVPTAQRLRIGRSNFRLPSDIQSKEPTLQVELWATAKVHQHSIRFKMDTKKHIVDLESFREMLHISPRIPGQSFAELPFEEEILEFLRFLGHSAQIKTLTDVNKLYQPWRSFAAVINRRNVDYAFLIWEDFVYQVEHKNQKKSNEMYYPRFTKVIIHHFMTKKPLIPRRNKVNWHYVRDDILFSTIKVVSRHHDTQQYGAILPIELTSEDIRNTKAYKEYYACATGEATPKPKASARKKQSGSDSSTTPPTPIATPTPTTTVVAAPRLSAAAKEGADRRRIFLNNMVPVQMKELVLNQGFRMYHLMTQKKKFHRTLPMMKMLMIKLRAVMTMKGDDEATESDGESEDEETREQEEESFDPILRTPEDSEDDGNNEEDQGLRISEEERMHEEEEADELYRDVDINQGRGLQVSQETEDSHQMPEAVREAVQIQTDRLQDSIQRENDEFLRTIDDNMKKIIKEQVKSQVKAQVTRILPRIEESVNTQLEAKVLTRSSHSSRTSYVVAADLSEMELKKILIEKMEGNKSIQRSNEQRNLYKALVEAYDADKTILDTYGESAILKRRREDDDQEGPSAGSDRGSKRRRERGEHAAASTPSEPTTESAGRSTTGIQSRQLSASESAFAEEPVQTTCQMEEPSHPVFETGAQDQPIVQTSQHPEWFSQPKKPPTPDRDWNKSLPAAQGNSQSWISALAKQTDARSSFNELLDTPIDFFNFIMNRLGVDTLTPKLLAGLTYELMRGS